MGEVGQRWLTSTRPAVSHPAKVLLGLAVQPHHALLPQTHPAHQAGEQPALVEEARRKRSLVLLEVHQVDDVLTEGDCGDAPLLNQSKSIHPLLLRQRLV